MKDNLDNKQYRYGTYLGTGKIRNFRSDPDPKLIADRNRIQLKQLRIYDTGYKHRYLGSRQ